MTPDTGRECCWSGSTATPHGDYLWELPAGRIDEGERPLAAGKRELREETGYTAKSWRRILFFYPSPGFMDETMTVFLARGLEPGTAQPEEDERIKYKLVPLAEAVRMISTGKICDGKTIAGVLWFSRLPGQRKLRRQAR